MDVLKIKTKEDLEAWFENYPPEVAQVVAARAALRALPFIVEGKGHKNFSRNVLLPVFWALTTSWVARKHPTHDVAAAASRAANAADAAAEAAFAAAVPAAAALSDSAAADAATEAAVAASSTAAAFYSASIAASSSSDAVWKESLQDCASLEAALQQDENAEQVARALAEQPLWFAHTTMPSEVQKRWDALKEFLSSAGDNWEVWSNWYQARLEGGNTVDVPNDLLETLDVEIANLDKELWEQGPAVVNAEIRRLMDEALAEAKARPSEVNAEIRRVVEEAFAEVAKRLPDGAPEQEPSDVGVEKITQNLTQDAAAFRFTSDKGPIDVVPFRSPIDEKAFAETTLLEARSKIAQLIETMTRSNSDGKTLLSAQSIAALLQAEVSEVNAALLRSKTRTLEAIGIAYAASGSEIEIFAGAVAEILDVTATLKDLQACYPALRNVERNAAKLEIAGREEAVEQEILELGEQARNLGDQTKELLTESTVEALNAHNSDIANAPTKEVKSEFLASAHLVVRNFAIAGYQKILSPVGLEALRVGKKHYHAAIDGSATGTKALAEKAPLVLLANYLGGPWLAGAAILSTFKPLKDAQDFVQKKLGKSDEKNESADVENDDNDITEA